MTLTILEYIGNITNGTIYKLTCSFDGLVYLLGDYCTYNEINQFNNKDQIELTIGIKSYDNNFRTITIWIQELFIKDIEKKNTGSELIYKINEFLHENADLSLVIDT